MTYKLRDGIRASMERMPRAACFMRSVRDALDRYAPAITTPWGFTLAGHPAMAHGEFEPKETKLIRTLLNEVDVFVNVGANVGYYCCHALSLGKPVIAIEPIRRNLHYLLKNIKHNGWEESAEVFPVALGSRASVLTMWGGDTGASLIKGWASIPESYATEVPVLTLDRVLGESLRGKRILILSDIEGAEWMMLQGAQQTLMHDPKPLWIVEISLKAHWPGKQNEHFLEIFELFFSKGYRAYFAEEVSHDAITLNQVRSMVDGRTTLEHNNFLFKV